MKHLTRKYVIIMRIFAKINRMSKQTITNIEAQIEQLTQERTLIFNEWIKTVKQNDREAEDLGDATPEHQQYASDLLAKQQKINHSIVQLINRLDMIGARGE